MNRISTGLMIILSLGLATACSLNRESAVSDMTTTACDRWDECGAIGEGKSYATYDECKADNLDNFYQLWPSEACGEGKITPAAYDDCLNRTATYPCGGSVLDMLTFTQNCNADVVCNN
jgi:hypothetical protein